MHDTYFFILFRKPIYLNLLLQWVIWHVLCSFTHSFIWYLACRCSQECFLLLILFFDFFFLPFEEVNLTIFLFHKSTFLVLCLKEVVIYRTVLLGVAEYSDITGSLLLVALKTIFPLIYFFIRTPFFVPQVSSHSLFVYQFPHNTSLFQVIFSASSLLLSFFISS